MEYQAKYNVTADLQRQAIKELFFAVFLKRKWIGIVVLAFFFVLSLVFVEHTDWILPSILGIGVMFLSVMWIKTYYMLQAQAEDYLRTLDDPLTTVNMTDSELEVRSSSGSKRLKWEMIDRVVESTNFYIPMIGKVPFICLPKANLSKPMSSILRAHRRE